MYKHQHTQFLPVESQVANVTVRHSVRVNHKVYCPLTHTHIETHILTDEDKHTHTHTHTHTQIYVEENASACMKVGYSNSYQQSHAGVKGRDIYKHSFKDTENTATTILEPHHPQNVDAFVKKLPSAGWPAQGTHGCVSGVLAG